MPDFALALVVKAVVAVARLLGLVLVARHFGSGGKGLITEALLPATTLVMIFKLGIDYASVMVLKRHREREDRLLGAILWSVVLSCGLVALLSHGPGRAVWSHLTFIPSGFLPLVLIALWLFPAQLFHDACLNSLLGKVGFRTFTHVKLIQPALFIGGLAGLWIVENRSLADEFNVASVLWTYPISFAVAGLVMFGILSRKLPVRPIKGFSYMKRLIVLGGAIQLVALLIYFNRRIDGWMIWWLMDPEDNGVYSVVVSILEFGLFVAQPLSSLVLMRSAGDEDTTSAARVLRFSLATSFIYLVGVCLFARLALGLAGPDFPDQGWMPLLALAPGILVFNIHQILSQVLYGRGEGHRLLGLMFVSLLLNVVVNYILLTRLPSEYRLAGVGLSSTLSYGLIGLGVLTLVTRRLGVTWKECLIPQRGDFRAIMSKFRKIGRP